MDYIIYLQHLCLQICLIDYQLFYLYKEDKNEKENFEEMLSLFCYEIQQIYNNTEEGNNQRWLMIDLEDKDKRYEDVKKIIEIRSK